MANKINRTDIYPNTTPETGDYVLGVDVSNVEKDDNGEVVTFKVDDLLSKQHNHTLSDVVDYGPKNPKDLATLQADTSLTYTAGQDGTVVAGDIVRTRAEGFAYEVLASGASGDITNSNGTPVQFSTLTKHNLAAFGFRFDGSDESALLKSALQAGGGIKQTVPAGKTITLGSQLSLDAATYPVWLEFEQGASIDVSGYTPASGTEPAFQLKGSLTTVAGGLSADISKRSKTVPLTDATGISQGDILVVENTTDYSFSKDRAEYHDGFIFEVASVSGNTVTAVFPAASDLPAASCSVFKMNPAKVRLDNPTFKNGSFNAGICEIMFGADVTVTNFKCPFAESYYALQFNKCYNVQANVDRIYNAGSGAALDYGVTFINSQKWTLTGNYIYARRHAVTTGGDGDDGAVPVRYGTTDCVHLDSDPSALVQAADFHGNTEDCRYVKCRSETGYISRGINNSFTDGYIGSPDNGVCVGSGDGVKGGAHRICRNTIYNRANPFSAGGGRGIIDFGGGGGGLTDVTEEDFTLIFEDNDCDGVGANTIQVIELYNRGTTKKVNASVQRNIFRHTGIQHVLAVQLQGGAGGLPDSDFLIVDNNEYPNSENRPKLFGPYNWYTQIPCLKGETLAGTLTITTDTGASFVDSAGVDFNVEYPANQPVSVLTSIATSTNYPSSNPLPRVGVISKDTLGFTPFVANVDSGTNFTAAFDCDVSWQSSVDTRLPSRLRVTPYNVFGASDLGAFFRIRDKDNVTTATNAVGEPITAVANLAPLEVLATDFASHNTGSVTGIATGWTFNVTSGSGFGSAINTALDRVTTRMTFEVTSYTSGDVRARIGGTFQADASMGVTGVGTYTISGTPGFGTETGLYSVGGNAVMTIENVTIEAIPSADAVEISSGNGPIWESDLNNAVVDYGDYVLHQSGDGLKCTFRDLGTNATVMYVTGSGVTTLTGQTINGATNLPTSDFYAYLAIDRALTTNETEQLTRWMKAEAGIS